jgi:hypothetical protein
MLSGVVNRLTVTVWLASSAVAVLAGPFGTYESMTLLTRTGYWAFLIALSIALSYFLRKGASHWFPRLSRNWRDITVPLLFSIIFSVIIDRVNHLVLDTDAHPLTHLEIVLFVLAISIMVTLIRRFLDVEKVEQGSDLQKPRTGRPRLLDRIGAPDGAHVQRLTVDDHYVIVFLNDGTRQKVLMRFADAVAEMEGQPGLLTHRSHWVSLDVVAGVCRETGREVVVLKDGGHVPLSRTYRGAFEERGFAAPAPARLGMTTE